MVTAIIAAEFILNNLNPLAPNKSLTDNFIYASLKKSN